MVVGVSGSPLMSAMEESRGVGIIEVLMMTTSAFARTARWNGFFRCQKLSATTSIMESLFRIFLSSSSLLTTTTTRISMLSAFP